MLDILLSYIHVVFGVGKKIVVIQIFCEDVLVREWQRPGVPRWKTYDYLNVGIQGLRRSETTTTSTCIVMRRYWRVILLRNSRFFSPKLAITTRSRGARPFFSTAISLISSALEYIKCCLARESMQKPKRRADCGARPMLVSYQRRSYFRNSASEGLGPWSQLSTDTLQLTC